LLNIALRDSTEQDLGIEWKSLEQTIKEAGEQIFELEKRESARN
jgi:hypothetical protein